MQLGYKGKGGGKMARQRRETNAKNYSNNKRAKQTEQRSERKRGDEEGKSVGMPAGPPAK